MDYELCYAGKMPREEALAFQGGASAPLRIERVYPGAGEQSGEEWRNLIVSGDNLQFLQTIYRNEDPLIKDRVKGKVRLIYIDPPFGTDSEFEGTRGQKAYTDKRKAAEFLEFIRRRLIAAREILAEDGSIYVHLDWRKCHYVKVIMDEVFGEENFKNEIVWIYTGPSAPGQRQFSRKHDVIFWYTKSQTQWVFNKDEIRIPYHKTTAAKFKSRGTGFGGAPADLSLGKIPEDWWYLPVVSRSRKEILDYPTQKPEALLERIIRASTNEGDLALDFFAGSGATAATAEKLNRRWITCDNGAYSFSIIQKRLLSIEDSRSLDDPKKKYGKRARTFAAIRLN